MTLVVSLDTPVVPGVTAAAATTTAQRQQRLLRAQVKLRPMWSVASAFPHMRGIQVWRQDAEESFRGAKLDGVEVDSWGRLTPGFHELAKVYPDTTEDQRIWAGVYLKGAFYYAIGQQNFSLDRGCLHRTANGGIEPWAAYSLSGG